VNKSRQNCLFYSTDTELRSNISKLWRAASHKQETRR